MITALPFEIFAALLGWLTLPLAIARFQVRDFTTGLWIGSAAAWLTAAHLLLIGAPAGAVTALAVALTITIQAGLGHGLAASLRYALALAAIAAACLLKEPGVLAFLPVIAFASARLAEAARHDLTLRVVMLFACALWIAYAIASHSLPIALGNSLALGSGVLGLWRFYGRQSPQTA